MKRYLILGLVVLAGCAPTVQQAQQDQNPNRDLVVQVKTEVRLPVYPGSTQQTDINMGLGGREFSSTVSVLTTYAYFDYLMTQQGWTRNTQTFSPSSDRPNLVQSEYLKGELKVSLTLSLIAVNRYRVVLQ